MARTGIFSALLLRVPRRFGRARDGATAVEFGLVAPLFFLIIAGLVEFGMFIWNKHSLEFAVEETGRSVMTMTSITEEAIKADLKGRLLGVDPAAVTASITQEVVGATTFVTIQVSYTYSFLMGNLLGLDNVAMQSKTRVPLNPPE
jgi:Flp pilus assembly protein TadG